MIDLGRGWKYPVRAAVQQSSSATGNGMATAQGIDHLRQSIILILMTPKGSRVMRPWFGSNLWKHIDSPINNRTLAAMRYEIYQALKEETRGSVTKILISNPEPHRLTFTVVFLKSNKIEVAVKLSYDRDMERWSIV